METSASFEARSAPLSYPTPGTASNIHAIHAAGRQIGRTSCRFVLVPPRAAHSVVSDKGQYVNFGAFAILRLPRQSKVAED